MRKKLILGVILALLLAVAGVPLAFAGGSSDGDDDDDVRILRLTSKTVQQAEVNVGDPAFGVGDRFVSSEDLFRGDEKVGVSGIDCVVVLFTPGPDPAGTPEAETAQCVATLSLAQGQITAQGLVSFIPPGPSTVAITGGTGAYRTAHGEVEVTEESPGVLRLTLKLILDDD
jgi:hypothetical protein